MRQRPALDCVRIARDNVRLAARTCGTADMASLQKTLHLLETAAAGLRQAEAEVRSGPPDDPGGLRREIALLKREISVMLRIIDGSAAVCRSLSMRLGCTALAYTPHGHAVTAPSSSAACELHG